MMRIARRTIEAIERDPLMTALLVTLAAGLLASWSHLARTFAEFYVGPFAPVLGGAAATAIDGTLYVLALVLGDLARRGADSRRVYGGVAALLVVSAVFNLDAALTALSGARPVAGVTVAGVDALDLARAVVGAATLPLVVAYLVHSYAALAAARRADDSAPAASENASEESTAIVPRHRRPAVVPPQNGDREQKIAAVLTHALANPDATYKDLGAAAGVSRQTATNYSRELMAAGRLARNGRGWEPADDASVSGAA